MKVRKGVIRTQIIEIAGWIGAAFILVAYGLLSLDIIAGDSYVYHLSMLIGSAGLAAITYYRRTFQPFVVNALFSVIAVIALIRLIMLA